MRFTGIETSGLKWLNDQEIKLTNGYWWLCGTNSSDYKKFRFQASSERMIFNNIIKTIPSISNITADTAVQFLKFHSYSLFIQELIKRRIYEAGNSFNYSTYNKGCKNGGFSWMDSLEGQTAWVKLFIKNNEELFLSEIKKYILTLYQKDVEVIDSPMINLNL